MVWLGTKLVGIGIDALGPAAPASFCRRWFTDLIGLCQCFSLFEGEDGLAPVCSNFKFLDYSPRHSQALMDRGRETEDRGEERSLVGRASAPAVGLSL